MSSFGFKKTILKQILGENKYSAEFQKLEHLNKLRNLFGHASLNLVQGNNMSDPKAEVHFNDPKKPDNIIDPADALQDFNKSYPEVLEWLKEISKDKGVVYKRTN
ncbi:MAG: hypothetical protein COV55_01610 [Candidatus Komeilibacteria bacterium CG11_big_fil_rev_8_21_14_0_20_36_20]|uniref:Uncharacterized protein n=1 Tax=Candidatus Komeilibacteria bacterium CG11_big_fil_rev_8_21_14_0_20_36_20 TaxID=1974477 RepID=A0A2H0NDY9_9BACT|nr:MAG: hypothetical protein COV55_01610 [Candidatus Komeilibacteria bacterium CG11_big_fil_rev_8_21_14_0_20_36_20]PIR81239.1 MAG: hypothetical protein COU21_04595 [Candidatus Komeilibacteria bacterium CG10_big_fil_rev_8_21_14_0_10_36_65]PJC55203.1 MAG: hypothetical protein CO027_03535 [Candidatus Komeilibacteria bacterium CG_4_9_14_0_2_um_filter_36_13]